MIARVASRCGIEIIVAVENNPEGEKLAEELEGIFEREGVKTIREIPEHGKDWSENLQYREEEKACHVGKGRVVIGSITGKIAAIFGKG